MKRILFAFLAAAVMAGCSTAPTTAPVEDKSSTPGATDTTGASTSGTTTSPVSGSTGMNPLKDPNNILSKRSVYFDYDSNAVKDEYRGLVQDHSRYMTTSKKDSRIRIEGNCDERGSREYNLALGQRRAESVKRVMTVLGVADNRIETISYGEEKPKAPGHDEASWAENRRADIRYAGE